MSHCEKEVYRRYLAECAKIALKKAFLEVDKEVLAVVSQHPFKIVRAEAINALLWNHGDSAKYKQFLRKSVN